jgi:hypothetical protein
VTGLDLDPAMIARARANFDRLGGGDRAHPFGPRHGHLPDPVEHTQGAPLRVVGAAPWSWPWRLNLLQRTELVRSTG